METKLANIDDQLIESELNALLLSARRVTSEENVEQIIKAFNLANHAHKGMRRKSGEPYILHPIAVAKIVVDEIGLGSKSIISALLHDVVEDTDITIEDIERMFGKKVASIVDGLTKLSTTATASRSQQADNFKKLLLSMVDDTRVILIKLADRLHNMRTLDSMPEYKQYKIAGETLFIYAPLAHRLGLYSIKSELEDLSLKHEHPKLYNELKENLKFRQTSTQYLTDGFIVPISNKLKLNNFDFEIKSRPKSIYSIWSKMIKKNIPFEEVYDISAIRIVFVPKPELDEKAQCWAIYSLVTDIYKPKPDRLRDWISSPKANGYEALHSTVMSAQGKWVEIQIRSKRMDEIAERGFAAHHKYKEGNKDEKESELDIWIKHIRELLDNPDPDSLEFLDAFKLNLSSSEIMIFTPDGDVHNMPTGSTVLDFAYEIHSKLGNKCIGAKLNSKLVPLNQILKSGDQVEILTSESQTPKYEWLEIAATAKARARIKESFKKERKELIEKGEREIEIALHKIRLTTNARILKKLLSHFNISSKEDLCFGIGKGTLVLNEIEKILATKTESKWVKYWGLTFGKNSNSNNNPKSYDDDDIDYDGFGIFKTEKSNPKSVNINEEVALGDYKRASCCNPIPGDDVVGFYDDEERIILHNRKCDMAIKLMSSIGDKMVDANWTIHKLMSFMAVIRITGIDQMGIVSKITKIISDEKLVNIRSLHFESFDGIFDGSITLYIPSTQELDNIMETLRKIKGVHTVIRQEKQEKA